MKGGGSDLRKVDYYIEEDKLVYIIGMGGERLVGLGSIVGVEESKYPFVSSGCHDIGKGVELDSVKLVGGG